MVRFELGDEVKVDFHGDGTMWQGLVQKVNEQKGQERTYDVYCKDGDTAKSVRNNYLSFWRGALLFLFERTLANARRALCLRVR